MNKEISFVINFIRTTQATFGALENIVNQVIVLSVGGTISLIQ